tara:strand:+ start:93 stop:959 length:867 start_codon:yes stop_codon:yes gene_type:complete
MNQKIGILGGGFGLYGYLPAFVNLDYSIFTLSKYQKFIESREDLEKYYENINFLSSEDEIYNEVNLLCFAKNPESQYNFLQSKESYKFEHLYLEKPLAHKLNEFENCIKKLKEDNQSISVFYSLSYLGWYKETIEKILSGSNQLIEIFWKINRNTNENSSWKNDKNKGGGFLNYYAIHFIKMFYKSNLKIENVKSKNDFLLISLNDQNLNTLKVEISSSEESSFKIYEESKLKIESDNPFLRKIIPGKPDPRIGLLEKYIDSNKEDKINTEEKVLKWLKLLNESILDD